MENLGFGKASLQEIFSRSLPLQGLFRAHDLQQINFMPRLDLNKEASFTLSKT